MNYKKYHKPFSNVANSDIGVLVIHGFTSTTSSMMYLAQKFADSGYNVELPPLKGHGTKWDDMNNVSYQDWIDDVENAYNILRQRSNIIFVCGLSMGGALALHLAEQHSEIKGLIIINNALIFTNPKFLFVPILQHILPYVPAVAGDIKKPDTVEIAYTKTSIKAVNQMLKLLKITKNNLNKIKMPALIFKSRDDHVIPIKSATYTLNNISSKDKELIWLKNSYHVAPLDNDKELIAEKSLEFIVKNI